jgi:hypothetical protein
MGRIESTYKEKKETYVILHPTYSTERTIIGNY